MKNIKVFIGFLVLTVVMTYPLATRFGTAIAGPPNDGFIHLYEMYWFKRALFDLHVWPLFDPETFYPFGYNLALSHITPSNTLLMMPVVLLGGPVVGFNTAVFLSFILSAFGAYLLVVYLTHNRRAGIVAGILFAFSAYRMHNLGQGWLPNLGTQWLPFALVYLDRLLTGRPRPLRSGALAGFFFALACLSSWYHIYIAGVAVGLYVLARGWPWQQKLLRRHTLAALVMFALVAAVMILPLAMPLLQYGASEKDIEWPLISADDASASLDDLLLPSTYHPLWGNLILSRRTPSYSVIVPGMVYLGIPALVLAAYALRRRMPAARSFLLIGLAGAILTLGLTLHLNGQRVYIPVPAAVEDIFSRAMLTISGRLALNPGSYWPFRKEEAIPIPLPGMTFSLFVPFGSTMRVFHRFGLDSSLGVAVLAGLGTAALLEQVNRRPAQAHVLPLRRPVVTGTLLAACLIAIVLFDIDAAPLVYGLSDTGGTATDAWLKQQPGDFSVMQLPLVRALNGYALYRAAIHGKKISYGYGTFYPKAWRAAVTALSDFPNPEAVDLLRSWNVRYVLLGEGAYKAGLVDTAGDSWDKVQERLKTTSGLRYVTTFDEASPTIGDHLSARLTNPWLFIPAAIDRTHVYEVLPK